MKVKDYITKSILSYPSLFKDKDWDKSKAKVLGHVFWTNGNGLDISDCGKFVYQADYIKDEADEWVATPSGVYGSDTFELPANYFDTLIYREEEEGDSGLIKLLGREKALIQESNYEFKPYPISKGFSLGLDIIHDKTPLERDWMRDLKWLAELTQEYFEGPQETNFYYPSEVAIAKDLDYFKSKGKGPKVRDLRKIWGYEEAMEVPTYEEVRARKEDIFNKHLKEQKDNLNFIISNIDKYI